MNKKEIKAIYFLLRDFAAGGYKKILVCMVFLSIVQGIRPYITAVLTGYLIDAVYRNAAFMELLKYALIGTSINAIRMVIEGMLLKVFNRHMEYMYEIQNRSINYKSLKMDYEYMEDTKTHNERQKLNSAFTRFGLIGAALSHLNIMLSSICSCICAFIIVIPMFFTGGSEQYGWIASPFISIAFFICLGLLIGGNYKILVYFNIKHQNIKKQVAPWENRRKFYMDILASNEPQKDLKIYKQYDLFHKETSQIIKEEKKIAHMGSICSIKGGLASQFVTALLGLLVYGFAGIRGFVGMISIGNVVTYASSIGSVSDSIFLFVQRMGRLKEVAVYAVNYVDFMSLEKLKKEGHIPLEKRQDNKFSIEFENVSFRYPGSEEYVIKDLNLSFVIGEKMAIVGKNGSGKTTFIKLLCRLYDVTEGSIKVNGIDIRKYDYQEYCNLFSVVFQDFCIFDFPLGENIACSTEVDKVNAIDALNRAGLEERMGRLKDGLKTYVGKGFDENGVNFSGGEKQKMAIARAIYKDAPLVIMDEPTAALDPESECEVFAGFDKMVGKKTAIYISHRLASCRFCEDILVFDKGKVVQRGTHEKLEKENGLYQELWNAQAQYYQQ